MSNISDTELLHDLMENDANNARELKAVASWDPSTGTVFTGVEIETLDIPTKMINIPVKMVKLEPSGKSIKLPYPWNPWSCETSHEIAKDEDTKLCCPGCNNSCDLSVCWCGKPRETHARPVYECRNFVPMGCTCQHVDLPPTEQAEISECEWDIL